MSTVVRTLLAGGDSDSISSFRCQGQVDGARHEAAFKARVALAAIRGDKTLSELASEHQVHANLISQWKRRLLANVARVFEEPEDDARQDHQAVVEELHRQVGKLHVELDWLKKKAAQLDR